MVVSPLRPVSCTSITCSSELLGRGTKSWTSISNSEGPLQGPSSPPYQIQGTGFRAVGAEYLLKSQELKRQILMILFEPRRGVTCFMSHSRSVWRPQRSMSYYQQRRYDIEGILPAANRASSSFWRLQRDLLILWSLHILRQLAHGKSGSH